MEAKLINFLLSFQIVILKQKTPTKKQQKRNEKETKISLRSIERAVLLFLA